MPKPTYLMILFVLILKSCSERGSEENQAFSSISEVFQIDGTNYSIMVELIDSVEFFNAKKSAKFKNQEQKKITDFETAKKMLEGIVEFDKNEFGYTVLKKINYRNGEKYKSNEEESFVAYYPSEDILLLEGGHASDVSFDLKNGKTTDEAGNPDCIVASPKNIYRLNGSFGGQECYSYFIQKNLNGQFNKVIDLSDAYSENNKIELCQISESFWQNDSILYIKEGFAWYPEENVSFQFYKITILHAEPKIEKKSITKSRNPEDFVPDGYVIHKIDDENFMRGDLNKDGLLDLVMLVKGTDVRRIVQDEYLGRLDRNRRGIIVLFNRDDHYELAIKNLDCFSSENEDGGVYFAPELWFYIKKGNLYVHYGHGRYGYWRYVFRYQNKDFELIGYDSFDGGVVTNRETSINFSTKKKITKININENADSGEEIYKTIKENIQIQSLLRLSEIIDFDELNISDVYSE